jgi:hypothetical protein
VITRLTYAYTKVYRQVFTCRLCREPIRTQRLVWLTERPIEGDSYRTTEPYCPGCADQRVQAQADEKEEKRNNG